MAKVLLLDEELTLLQTVGELLRAEGHQVTPFTRATAGLQAMESMAPELVVVHVGLEKSRLASQGLLQKARQLNSPALVLLILGSAFTGTPVEVMKRGAFDYLIKPFAPDELKLRVQRALSYHSALMENASLRRRLQSKSQFQDIIAVSSKMLDVLSVIERVADADTAVLLEGEPGTGKELMARTLHGNSRRRLAPFIKVSCGAFPEALLDTELFGEGKTSWSPNPGEPAGLLHEAEGGTLFFEDVGALPVSIQARLEEALQGRRGANGAGQQLSDVRLIAASQEPLTAQVASGLFRANLYRALAGVTVALPPLKDRPEDIPLLVARFLESKIHRGSGRTCTMTPEAVEACRVHAWPGNVRELQEVLEQACSFAQESTLQLSDLPHTVRPLQSGVPAVTPLVSQNGTSSSDIKLAAFQGSGSALSAPAFGDGQLLPLRAFIRDQEFSYLHHVLARVGGSKEQAAERLGISVATLYRKLSEPADPPPVSC